ncbi:MAG: 50S ribosomal protein L22 [Anaerolineales bacterium]|nr:50S ribosomal protein L22 [Anaerolineae bacterium]PWB52108.1 MAG: 50S ribosomal protein L22 [Anaerolineales bacterium]
MPSHDIRAQAMDTNISAQKARLVVDAVRGKDVVQAMTMLKFMPNYAARPVSKLLASAVANAEENFGVSRDDLFVYRIYADEAPTRKWRRFGPRGRFMPWLRRSSHLTVILREREGK